MRFLILFFVFGMPVYSQEQPGTSIKMPVESRAWQKRRFESQKILTAGLNNPGDPKANIALDELLTDYENHILTRTPLENLDLIGRFYIPKDGVEKCLPVVVLNCVLGWYDALRFASESGRAEILNNERMFGMVYLLGGEKAKLAIMKLASENPGRIKILVEQGMGFAEKFRNTTNYDRRWPNAFGLERMIDAMGGNSEAKLLPKGDWDKAWMEAKSKVTTYYGVQ